MAFEAAISEGAVSDEHTFNARFEGALHANAVATRAGQLHEADCVRAAQALIAAAQKSLAILPLSQPERAFAVCEQLARSVADLSRSNVALLSVDAALAGERVTSDASEYGIAIAGRWLAPDLALLVPCEPLSKGLHLSALQSLLAYATPRATRVIADLSGLAQTSMAEALAACHLFDGITVLAVSGVTRERDVLRVQSEIAPDRHVSALLLERV